MVRLREMGSGMAGRENHRAALGARCARVLLSVFLLVLLREAAAVPNLRGVGSQDEKYFQTAIIRCRDGSKTFPQERLNDDFCDCVDGTDEPGTNACPNGKFYCKNLGHKPVELFSSRVNDGICDCCDGSDEYDGKVKCPNTCRESGKQSTEKMKKKLATFKDGVIIRNRDVENAQKQRTKHEEELGQLKKEEKNLKSIVDKLKVEKEAVEKQEQAEKENERREKEQAEKEKERREKEELEQREKEEQERREKETATEMTNPQQAEEEAQSQVEVLPENPQEVDPAHAEMEGLEHLTEAERGRVIASRWTGEDVSDILSKEAIPDDHHIAEVDDDEEDSVLMHENDEDEDYGSPHYPISEAFRSEVTNSEKSSSSWWPRLVILPDYFLRLFRLNRVPVNTSEAERIRKDYQESYDKLHDIERKISNLEMRTGQDFGRYKEVPTIDLKHPTAKKILDGLEGEFYGFYDSCFELKDKKYTYKVCPYNDATQTEGHSTTRLGRWQGFKEDYKEMIFQHGEKCWNGPERSLRVKMRCGIKLELRSVDEPSRCEYVGEFSTPALCTPSKVQALEKQLLHNDPESLPNHDEL